MTTVLRRTFEGYTPELRELLGLTAEEVIRRAVNRLLESLYRPNRKIGFVVDRAKVRRLGFLDESINWGDLGCADIETYEDGEVIVAIEEVSPDATRLCQWIESWLHSWGWTNTTVRSEW